MKNSTKLLILLLALVMAISFAPAFAFAGNGSAVSYTKYSWDDATESLKTETITISDYKSVTAKELSNGTYVVDSDLTVDELYVYKDHEVNLVVKEGVTLTVEKGIRCGYNKSGEYSTLNIFGEGKIVTTGKENQAGIGGGDDEANGNITIHGTTIEATGGKHAAGIGGGEGGKDPDGKTSIKIYAGTVTATGGIDGAGIGGGDCQPGAHTYIYSGIINAGSEKHGAGIGGGDEEGTLGIWIYGGRIEVLGGEHGAGIGAGEEGGNMRNASDGGGINILGGEVWATGGTGAAGIGGGYNENMSGTITIAGSPTLVSAQGGYEAAGIGSGRAGTAYYDTNGDMKGTITINCSADTPVVAVGGNHGAGIGAGQSGNMKGKCYILNGDIYAKGGTFAAGIGGGNEGPAKNGGEGGTVYIGGGKLEASAGSGEDDVESRSYAIGRGGRDGHAETKVKGTVYISAGENTTGNYMKVKYTKFSDAGWTMANASERANKCKQEEGEVLITVCDHKDFDGNSGLTYTIDGDKHTKKCKYCGYKITEPHSGSTCECGYDAGTRQVEIWDSGMQVSTVPLNSEFVLPDRGDEVRSKGLNPDNYYRVKGWQLNGDSSGRIYEQGEAVIVEGDMQFYPVEEKLYQINFEAIQNGSIRTFIDGNEVYPTEGKVYAAVGDMLSIQVEANPGYKVKSASYKIMTGYDISENYEVVYSYSDSFDMPLEVDGYQIQLPAMPTVENVDYNQIVIKTEIEDKSEYSILIPEITGGTVAAYPATATRGQTVTLTVTPEANYRLDSIVCRTIGGEEVALTAVGENTYTFIMPVEDVKVILEWEDVSPAAQVFGHTLSLEGLIAINTYLRLDSSITDNAGAYTVEYWNGETLVSSTKVSDVTSKTLEGYTVYGFSVSTVAKEMDTVFTMKIKGPDGYIGFANSDATPVSAEEGLGYSITDYLDNRVAKSTNPKMVQLAKDMKAYGTYVGHYFAVRDQGSTEALPNIDDFATVTADDLSAYACTSSGAIAGFTYRGATLVLEDSTSFRLYFEAEDYSQLTITVDGKPDPLEIKSGLNMYYVEIPGIVAKDLDVMYDFTISDGSQTVIIKNGPFGYAYWALTHGDESPQRQSLQYAMMGLYRYNQSAKSYFNANS